MRAADVLIFTVCVNRSGFRQEENDDVDEEGEEQQERGGGDEKKEKTCPESNKRFMAKLDEPALNLFTRDLTGGPRSLIR